MFIYILASDLNDLKLLRNFVNWKHSSKTPQVCLPSMSEGRFVALCKTMYSLIENVPVNQEIHNNISKISNLYNFYYLTFVISIDFYQKKTKQNFDKVNILF